MFAANLINLRSIFFSNDVLKWRKLTTSAFLLISNNNNNKLRRKQLYLTNNKHKREMEKQSTEIANKKLHSIEMCLCEWHIFSAASGIHSTKFLQNKLHLYLFIYGTKKQLYYYRWTEAMSFLLENSNKKKYLAKKCYL